MKNIHITLLGGQPVPVYVGYRQQHYDQAVFIYSHQSEKYLEKLTTYCQADDIHPILLDAVDIETVKKCAENLFSKYVNDHVSINISSGTKIWSILFYDVFRQHANSEILYVDQNNIIVDLITWREDTGSIDIRTRFDLSGSNIETLSHIDDYTEEDARNLVEIENLRKFNHKDFNTLSNIDTQLISAKTGSYSDPRSPRPSKVEWNWNDQPTITVNLIKNNGKSLQKTLSSPNIKHLFFANGWFEYKAAKTLKNIPEIKDIWMNLTFAANNHIPLNEIDIILETEQKLLFLECKTQITKTIDIDKFRSAVKNYGGMGSKGLFITEALPKENAIEKFKHNEIQHFRLDPQLSEKQNAENFRKDVLSRIEEINTR